MIFLTRPWEHQPYSMIFLTFNYNLKFNMTLGSHFEPIPNLSTISLFSSKIYGCSKSVQNRVIEILIKQ